MKKKIALLVALLVMCASVSTGYVSASGEYNCEEEGETKLCCIKSQWIGWADPPNNTIPIYDWCSDCDYTWCSFQSNNNCLVTCTTGSQWYRVVCMEPCSYTEIDPPIE